MKQKFIALLLVLCMAASLCLMTGCGNKGLKLEEVEKDPISYLKAGSEMVMEAWGFGGSGEELTALLTNLAKQGEVELNLDMTDYKLKNVLAFDGKAVSNELTGTLAGEDIDLLAYLSKDDIALRSKLLTGTEDTYGLKVEEFLAQGTESNLAKALEMTEDDVNMLKELLEGDDEADEEDLGAMLQEWIQKLEALEEDAWALYEDMDIEVAEETITIDGAEADAIVITIPITTEFMQSATELGLSLFEDMEGFEDFNEVISEMDELKTDGTYVYYLNKESGALMQCDMDLTSNDGVSVMEEQGTVVYGVDPAAGRMGIDVTMEVDGEELAVEGTVTKSTEEKVECIKMDMTVDAAGEQIKMVMDLDHNKETGEYTLSLDMEDVLAVQLTGVCKLEKSGAEFSIKSIKSDDVTIDVNIGVKVNTEAVTVAKPEYKDLLTMEETELNTVVSNFATTIMAMGSLISFEDPYSTPNYDTDGLCAFCYDAAVTEVKYLGEMWPCCSTCANDIATVMAGNYCDSCWTETTELTQMDLYGIPYRLCQECYALLSE